MFKYILVMMSVNETPTLPIAIQLSDFNTGYYDTSEFSEIPALLAILNYTLFKYSPFDDDDFNDVDYFFLNYDFECKTDSWSINGNEYRYHSIKEISFDDFRKLNSLNLLSLVNPFNYEGKYLTKDGCYKFDDYMSSLANSFKNQIINDFKKVAFDLSHTENLVKTNAIEISDLLSSYPFGSTLEHIDTVANDDGSRSYNSFTLEGCFCSKEIQLIFSNYTTQHKNREFSLILPLDFEIMINDEVMEDDEVLQHYGYMVNLIKTDLYKNTFK